MRLISAVLILLPMLAAAETAYVTDTLRLGLHQAEDTSDRPFRNLESGQELEILSRSTYYAHVQLPELLGAGAPPATLSGGVLTDLLREDLGFEGLVLRPRVGFGVERFLLSGQGRGLERRTGSPKT